MLALLISLLVSRTARASNTRYVRWPLALLASLLTSRALFVLVVPITDKYMMCVPTTDTTTGTVQYVNTPFQTKST